MDTLIHHYIKTSSATACVNLAPAIKLAISSVKHVKSTTLEVNLTNNNLIMRGNSKKSAICRNLSCLSQSVPFIEEGNILHLNNLEKTFYKISSGENLMSFKTISMDTKSWW